MGQKPPNILQLLGAGGEPPATITLASGSTDEYTAPRLGQQGIDLAEFLYWRLPAITLDAMIDRLNADVGGTHG